MNLFGLLNQLESILPISRSKKDLVGLC